MVPRRCPCAPGAGTTGIPGHRSCRALSRRRPQCAAMIWRQPIPLDVAVVTFGGGVSSLPVPPRPAAAGPTGTVCDLRARASMLNLKIITGSTRPGRAAGKVIPWITAMSREHGDFDVDALDLRDWPLPMFGETLAASATRATPRSPCPRSGSGMPRSPKATPTCSSRPAGHDRHRRPHLPRHRAQVPQPGRSRAAAQRHLQPAPAGRHPDAGRPAVPAPARRARRVVTARGGPAMTPDKRPP